MPRIGQRWLTLFFHILTVNKPLDMSRKWYVLTYGAQKLRFSTLSDPSRTFELTFLNKYNEDLEPLSQ